MRNNTDVKSVRGHTRFHSYNIPLFLTKSRNLSWTVAFDFVRVISNKQNNNNKMTTNPTQKPIHTHGKKNMAFKINQ